MNRLLAAAFPLAVLAVVPVPTPAQVTCADIEFTVEVKERYPLIEDACLDVIEREDGRYVVLKARVASNEGESLVIEYMHSDGTWGPYIEVTPPDDYEPRIGGLPTPWRQVEARQELNVYVPEGRWALAMVDVAEPETDFVAVVPVSHAVREEPAEVVERTAARTAEPPAEAAPAESPPVEEAPAEPMAEEAQDDGFSMMWFLFVAVVAVGALYLMSRRREA